MHKITLNFISGKNYIYKINYAINIADFLMYISVHMYGQLNFQ